METDPQYILAIDVGSTTIRGHVYNEKAELVGQSVQRVSLNFSFCDLSEEDRRFDSGKTTVQYSY